LSQIAVGSSLGDRWKAIEKMDLGTLCAAPGHQVLRNPPAVLDIAKKIQNGTFVAEGQKPILNIVTNSLNEILTVDIWDGHHRMAAIIIPESEN